MLMHSTQFPPVPVPGAEYYRFKRDGDGRCVLATLSGRTPKDLKRSGATYEEILSADRTGYFGIAAVLNTGETKLYAYPSSNGAEDSPTTKPQLQAWHEHRVVVFDSRFDTHINDLKHYDTWTLREVFDAAPVSRKKKMAPAMIPSSYNQFDARKHEAQRERGRYVALTGDIDCGNVPLESLLESVCDFVGDGVAFLIYSSSSASAANRKWRVVIPLAHARAFEAWEELQEAFFSFMEARGIAVDWTLARAAQPVHLPNIPPDNRDASGCPLFYECTVREGGGLTAEVGAVASALSDLRDARAREATERSNAQEAAKKVMQARGSAAKKPVVEAFNQGCVAISGTARI